MDDLRNHGPRGPRSNGARLIAAGDFASDKSGKRIARAKHWTWEPPKRKRRKAFVLKADGRVEPVAPKPRITTYGASNVALAAHQASQRKYKRSVWAEHNADTQ